jgi:hypothetical protein
MLLTKILKIKKRFIKVAQKYGNLAEKGLK